MSYHNHGHHYHKENGHKYSKVRFVHNVADSPNVDIYVDKKLIASDIPYKKISDYIGVKSGRHEFVIKITRTKNVLLSKHATVVSDKAYTYIISGSSSDPKSLVILATADDTECPPSGKSKVRFIHASAGSPAVDVLYESYDGYMELFENYEYTDATSPYKEINSGKYRFTVTATGTNTSVIDPIDVTLKSGKVYTIIASGIVNNDKFPLRVLVKSDEKNCIYGM